MALATIKGEKTLVELPKLFDAREADAGEGFFVRRAQHGRPDISKAMIGRSAALPIARQAKLLRLSRSSVFYVPRQVPPARQAIMHRIDALHLEYQFAGSQMLRVMRRAEGVAIGRLAAAPLMRRMGIEVLYRRPNTSKLGSAHKIYPYLLRGLVVDCLNQVVRWPSPT